MPDLQSCTFSRFVRYNQVLGRNRGFPPDTRCSNPAPSGTS